MKKYHFTPQALNDLFEIWSHIARDSPEAADRVEEVIHISCEFLADSPMAGLVREDLTALPVRFWQVQPYRNYWLVYDPASTPLRVIRILHRARNIPPLFS